MCVCPDHVLVETKEVNQQRRLARRAENFNQQLQEVL
jgi:hypothetical protein